MLLTASVIVLFAGWVAALWPVYHVFGTDQTGNDVLFQAIKSIRTAVVIGSLATLATLPFAIVFGILAGYYKGWVDDAIQYLYTMLSSIPSVLLIAAFVLMIQVFVDKNPQMFETALQRADIRLFLLAAILGLTGWAGLARLLRAETLKLSELDYVQAARAFGVSNAGIMRRHILPNVTHVVLIVAVLDFSGLVLYEAVLSYVGVGVDPTTNSFGTMINSARNEMIARPGRVVDARGRVRLHGRVRAVDAVLRERGQRGVRSARARLPCPPGETGAPDARTCGAGGRFRQRLGDVDARDREPHYRDRLRQRPRARGRRALTDDRARRDLCAGRRVGMRQVDDGAVDPAAAAGCRARHRRYRRRSKAATSSQLPEMRMRDIRGHRISIIFQEPSTSLNPVMTVGRQITEVIERHTSLRGGAARSEGGRLAEARRHSGAASAGSATIRSRCPADRSSA